MGTEMTTAWMDLRRAALSAIRRGCPSHQPPAWALTSAGALDGEGEVLTVALLLERNARQLVAQDQSLWHYLVPLWRERTGASRRAVMIPRPRTATS